MDRSIVEILQSCSLFKEMFEKDLEALAPLFTEKDFAAGTTVFLENMPGESLYLIRTGKVQISKMVAEGREEPLHTFGPGDYFGEMAILDGGERSATARVLEDARLLRIRRGDFEAFCDSHPRIALRFTRNIVKAFSRRIRANFDAYKQMLLWTLDKSQSE